MWAQGGQAGPSSCSNKGVRASHRALTLPPPLSLALQGPLGTWVERESCYSMLAHLLLGFELEMYEPEEYGMLYW